MEINFNLNCKDETFITLLETIGKFTPMPREEIKKDGKSEGTKEEVCSNTSYEDYNKETKFDTEEEYPMKVKQTSYKENLGIEESQTSHKEEKLGMKESHTSPRAEAKADTDEKQTTRNKKTKPSITLEQLRERLALMSQQGNHENVKALLRKYGGERLTDIHEDSYEELFNEAVNEAAMEEKA